jgi:hypothetical protein
VDLQLRRLGPLRTPAAWGVAVRLRFRRSRRFQGVRLQQGTRRTAQQPPHLILQPLDLRLLVGNDLQQTLHYGRLLALGDLGPAILILAMIR